MTTIDGFQYEEGFEYVIDVKVEEWEHQMLDDADEYKYSLIQIVSKEQKDSDVPILTDNISECLNYPDEEASDPSIEPMLFQGDLQLTEVQASVLQTKSGCISDKTMYWTDNVSTTPMQTDSPVKIMLKKPLMHGSQKPVFHSQRELDEGTTSSSTMGPQTLPD